MGVVLPHEHIFIDLRRFSAKPADPSLSWLVDARVTMETLGDLRHHGNVCKDNLVLDDPETAAKELMMFKDLGGGTVIDVTCRGIGPRPLDLRALSEKTGLKIISGCGYYVDRSHAPDTSAKTVDQIADEIVKEITEGIGGTDVRAGIIGEVGTSQPITENEKKVLVASAHAQKVTGVAISVHFHWRGKHGPQVVRLLESEGVDPAKVILGHQDDILRPTLEYYVSLAETGAFVQFDCFGSEAYSDELGLVHARDVQRVDFVERLIDAGYVDNLLLSHDVAYKMHMRTYGGYGYGHILRTIVPMLRARSVTEDEIKQMLVENPKRAVG
jgi:phosphotriesterase-related protein